MVSHMDSMLISGLEWFPTVHWPEVEWWLGRETIG